MSAPVDADLLKADSWTMSNRLEFDQAWPGTVWLEDNVVITPQEQLVNILRVECKEAEKAAIVHISKDGKSVSFDPAKDFIDFFGGKVDVNSLFKRALFFQGDTLIIVLLELFKLGIGQIRSMQRSKWGIVAIVDAN